MKKRTAPRRRNPVARALRRLRPQVVPSAKGYKRKAKHKGRSEINDRNGLSYFYPIFFDRFTHSCTLKQSPPEDPF